MSYFVMYFASNAGVCANLEEVLDYHLVIELSGQVQTRVSFLLVQNEMHKQ